MDTSTKTVCDDGYDMGQPWLVSEDKFTQVSTVSVAEFSETLDIDIENQDLVFQDQVLVLV